MENSLYFNYSNEDLENLIKKDKRLGEIIKKLGKVNRGVNSDLFSALVRSICGQQISLKAQQTIWTRITQALGEITPQKIIKTNENVLQSFGLSFRKVNYIKEAANKVFSNELNLESLQNLNDEEICKELTKLNGVGIWTAQMLMIFSMQKMNVLSYYDLGILRGLRMVYRHSCITKELYQKYFKRFSPYNTLASFYLWEVSNGNISNLLDPANKNIKKQKK